MTCTSRFQEIPGEHSTGEQVRVADCSIVGKWGAAWGQPVCKWIRNTAATPERRL